MSEGFDFENIKQDFSAHKARILAIGVGGAGNNTITTLSEMGIRGASTIAVNTDAKHLLMTKADKKVLIGKTVTKGLGAGGYPEVGKNAAIESKTELRDMIRDTDLVFLTCGLGGGTGTGALPVIAKYAKDAGAIVLAVVTLPFKIEKARIERAEDGLVQMREIVDTAIVIENQKLLDLAGNLPIKKAFGVADSLIATMIKGITETISEPSLVNLDYADVRAIMQQGGVASIGVGESDGSNRAEDAIRLALNHPLLEVDYKEATGAMVQVIGGADLTLDEINHVGEILQKELAPNAQIIWGARIIPEYDDRMQVITIVTGVRSPFILGPTKSAARAEPPSREGGLRKSY